MSRIFDIVYFALLYTYIEPILISDKRTFLRMLYFVLRELQFLSLNYLSTVK
jgi:hypothetical protein